LCRLYRTGDLGLFVGMSLNGPLWQMQHFGNVLIEGRFSDRDPRITLYRSDGDQCSRRIRWAFNKSCLVQLFVEVALIIVALRLPVYVTLEVIDHLPWIADHLDRALKVRILQSVHNHYEERIAANIGAYTVEKKRVQ